MAGDGGEQEVGGLVGWEGEFAEQAAKEEVFGGDLERGEGESEVGGCGGVLLALF